MLISGTIRGRYFNMILTLKNFRRFSQASFDLSQSTLFVGPNGVGKTTILEAIHYLSVGRSHRARRDRELIGWNAEAAHASVAVSPDLTVERSVAIQGQQIQRRARRNGVGLPLLYSLGLFHVVLFAPELVDLFTGSPSLRRRYLDILLSSTEPRYAKVLAEYQQALKHRNQLFYHSHPSDASFEPWEAILADRGRILTGQRRGAVEFLADLLPDLYKQIAGKTTRTPKLSYQATVPDEGNFEALLASRRDADRRTRATSIGPHRDDLLISIDGYLAETATSRGEQRSLLLALKRAELQFFESQASEAPPILLLDDMFSELDEARIEALADLITDRRCLMTTTDATTIPNSIRSKVVVTALEEQPVAPQPA